MAFTTPTVKSFIDAAMVSGFDASATSAIEKNFAFGQPLTAPVTLATVYNVGLEFATSPYFQTQYSSMSVAQFCNTISTNLTGSGMQVAGELAYYSQTLYTAYIQSGLTDIQAKGEIAAYFAEQVIGADPTSLGLSPSDQALFQNQVNTALNRTTVSGIYADSAVPGSTLAYATTSPADPAWVAAQNALIGVTSNNATVLAQDAKIAAAEAVTPNNPALITPLAITYTLTTGIDTNQSLGAPAAIPAGSTVTGVLLPAGFLNGTNTLNPGDTLNFNGGTLSIVDNGGFASTATVNELAGTVLTGPYNFEVTENGALGIALPIAGAFDFTASTQLISAESLNSSQSVALENLPNLSQAILSGAATAGAGKHLFYHYLSPTAAVSLAVDGGINGAQIINDSGIPGGPLPTGSVGKATHATIASTGAANGTLAAPDVFSLTGGAGFGSFAVIPTYQNGVLSGAPIVGAFLQHTVTSLTVNATTGLVAELFPGDFKAATGDTLTVSGTPTLLGATDSVTLLSTDAYAFPAFGTAPTELPFTKIDASGLTAGGLTIDASSFLTSFVGGAGGGNELLYGSEVTPIFVAGDFLNAGATSINGGGGTGNVLSAELLFTPGVNLSIFTNWQILDVTNLTNVNGLPVNAALPNDAFTGVQFSAHDFASDTVNNIASTATVAVNGNDYTLGNAVSGTAASVQLDSGLVLTHLGGSGTLAVTFNNQDTTGTDSLQLGVAAGPANLTSSGDTAVSFTSNGAGFANSLSQLAETDNHLTTVTIAGSDLFGLGLDLFTGTIFNGAITNTGGPATLLPTASSLTTIDASATTGGVFIAAGDTSGTPLFHLTTYTGLKILGGSGTDYIYNGATNGSIVDLNGAGDQNALSGDNASIVLGTGAGDIAYVGTDPIGGAVALVAGVLTVAPVLVLGAGTSVNESVTFGAGATATLSVWTGAENGGLFVNPAQHSLGLAQTSIVSGATTGTTLDFTHTGLTGGLVNTYTPVAADTVLSAEVAAVAGLGANKGVADFSLGGNEYVIAHTTVVAGLHPTDAIVELVGVQNHAISLSAGVAHVG